MHVTKLMQSFRMFVGIVVVLSILAIPNTAEAAGFSLGTCSLSDVQANGMGAIDCINLPGNDRNYKVGSGPRGFENYINSTFGLNSVWSLFGVSDDSKDKDPLNNIASGKLQFGTWSLDTPINESFVITLKAGNFFAAYLFPSSFADVAGGTFSVDGVTTGNKGQHADLSHMSLYIDPTPPQSDPPHTAVPEPPAMATLALGLLGLAVIKKRFLQT